MASRPRTQKQATGTSDRKRGLGRVGKNSALTNCAVLERKGEG